MTPGVWQGRVPRLLVCSHRGPVSYREINGELREGPEMPGGLVPVLTPVLSCYGGKWISAAISDADRIAAKNGTAAAQRRVPFETLMLDLPKVVHRRHYQVVSVAYLGKLFHYLFQPAYDPCFGREFREAWQGYREVNRLFADATIRERESEVLLVQDYHLMMLAAQLNDRLNIPKIYFHHVPWCEPDYYSILSAPFREEVLEALLQFDVVAFHTQRWACAFIRCCETFLTGSRITEETLAWRGKRVRVISAPAHLDSAATLSVASQPRTDEWVTRFQTLRDQRWTLVRVDRADLWKNALRGFLAFEEFLRLRPDLAGKVWFLAILSPSRMWLPEYRRYISDCKAVVTRVNSHWAKRVGKPVITLLLNVDVLSSDRHRALAGLRIADAVLVNSMFDGLNLVAKEAILVGEARPVVILSRNAGAHAELANGAISIDPFDVEQTAEAIERAYLMPDAERERRTMLLRDAIISQTASGWIEQQLAALE